MMSFAQPPQPFASDDAIHQAFGQSQGGYDDGGGGGFDSEFQPTAVLVTDYRSEVPEDEGEGQAYHIEKRNIRETVDLADAYVFVWGDGEYGKLGQQNTERMNVPYIVSVLQKLPIRMVALGKHHSVFLGTEGQLLACGYNGYGQLGTGEDAEFRTTPVLIQSVTGIKSVAAGQHHNLAVTTAGKLMSWGSGSWGKLGLGSDTNVKTPRLVASLSSSMVETIACGGHHSVCITVTGDVWTWGKGMRGQLGHNSVKEEYSPRLCALLRRTGAENIKCGDDHTLVLLRNGALYSFGANGQGQLGLGDSIDRAVPTQIPAFNDDVADIATYGCGSMALTNSGRVYTFGDAKDSSHHHRVPTLMKRLPKTDLIVAIARSSNTIYAVSDSGNLFRWTASSDGGHAVEEEGEVDDLEPFHAIKGVVRLYAGYNHMAVICTADMGCTQTMITRDRATTWSNDPSKASLEKISDGTVMVPIQASPEHLDDVATEVVQESPSRQGDGYIMTYGKGVDGRLGHGLEYTRCEESTMNPKKVHTMAKMSTMMIVCAKDSTAALTDTGKLFMWGKSAQGKLGLGRAVHGSVVVPMPLPFFNNKTVCLVSLGRNHTACLTDDHRFWTWGSNTFGQLGIPAVSTSIPVPEEIGSLRQANVRDVACGGWHTVVCTYSGAVFTCGKGWHGQLGQGDYESLTAQSKTLSYFKKIPEGFGDHKMVRVYGSKETTACLAESGRVFTWGQGDEFQLGHDSTNNESIPREVEALARIRIIDLSLGDSHMLALDEIGLPYSWGKGTVGQLGHGELGEKERVPRVIELCRRTNKGFTAASIVTRDLKWGSFYFQRMIPPGETEEQDVERRQRGKVCMISANANYSLFVLERLANSSEINAFKEAMERGFNLSKKMTEMTIIRELFACGSGKGGVLQNIGKENEFIPKYLPETEEGEELQDIIQVSAGAAHVGILTREDVLRNMEWRNIEEMEQRDKDNNAIAKSKRSTLEVKLLELVAGGDEEEEEVTTAHKNPFAVEVEAAVESYLTSIPGFDSHKWLPSLMQNHVDLETLSLLRSEDDLKLVGVTAIGARRRLLKEIPKLSTRHPPVFYGYQNSRFVYISWPPNRADEIAKAQRGAHGAAGANPFAEFLKKKAGGKVLRCLVRYAESKHLETIRDRANLRYQTDPDGTNRLFTWGCGLNGRLGHGYGLSYATPHEVHSLPASAKVVEVACGCEHSICRTYDGSVLSWGNGDRGQLGTTDNYHGVGINVHMRPQPVFALKRYFILQISAGRWHNAVLTSDRSVYVWGAGHFGQLGLDSKDSRGMPTLLKALDGRAVCKILCGGWHTAAITESGKFLTWGKNTHGQLGLGDARSITYPKICQILRYEGKVRTAALGANHTLVVMVANKVFAMGEGEKGQLGLNDPKRRDYVSPVEIEYLTNKNVFEVAAGDVHSLALSVFGEVWAWGGSPFGQLGHGGITDILRPTPLLERHNIPPNVKHIYAGYTFSMALTTSGEVYSWGQGESGELGHPPKVLVYAPMLIVDFRDIMQISCGHRHAAAVQFFGRLAHVDDAVGGGDDETEHGGASKGGGGSGTATPTSRGSGSKSLRSGLAALQVTKKHGFCFVWGEDTCGQLGMRGLQAARSATLMQGLVSHSIVWTACNSDITAFVTESGALFVCGSGEDGRLGLGHLAPAPTPMEIRVLSHLKVVKVACGYGHCLALSEDRRVFAWGEGTWGNTGVANSAEVMEPQELHSLAPLDCMNVYCGGFHSAAVTSVGHLYTWGKNTNGQLGIGTVTMAEESPTKVDIDGVVIDCGLGRNHSAFIAQVTAPNLMTCGMNSNGQLGHDDFVDRCDPMPVVVLDDRQIISVGCGAAHTACVSQFGDVITFGNGRSGQLGVFSGIDTDHAAPVQLQSFSEHKVVKVVCGQEITAAITERGDVYAFGRESALGLGGNSARNAANPVAPKEVEGLTGCSHLALGNIHASALFQSTADLGHFLN